MTKDSSESSNQQRLRIGFIHADLGIGGAEQLVVNLAVALKNKGHSVIIYTPHHDKNHCFPETRDGTIPVEVAGRLFPQTIFGYLWALCANIRMILCTIYMIFFGFRFDLIIVDQVSVVVPILRFFNRKVLFYSHFPEKLLCVQRRSIVKRIYRFFIDWTEEISLLFANSIVVNSKFTRGMFNSAFPVLSKYKQPEVLYPAINFAVFDLKSSGSTDLNPSYPFFVSLNRYERKKNVNLAIQAFAKFVEDTKNKDYKLVVAGGYDNRIPENIEHHKELAALAEQLKVTDRVVFKFSISNEERISLLNGATALLYTPENEHFGIVPVEGMYMKTPVVVCDSGGPKESVVDNETGFRLATDPKKWAEKLAFLVANPNKAKEMGENGRKRAVAYFGLAAFADSAEAAVKGICGKQKVATTSAGNVDKKQKKKKDS